MTDAPKPGSGSRRPSVTPHPGMRGRPADAFGDADASNGTANETADIHRLMVEGVRDYAIFALDRTGHILSWNLGARRLKGYEPEEIIGRHFSIFYPPEDVAAGKPEWELAEATKVGRVEDEGWRVRKDGTRFWANVVITALRTESGELVGFGKVTRDLTERRRAEEALRESEERFRLLVQSVRDYGIFMLDPDGRVVSWNDGARRINGYTADEIIGRHFSIFYPPEDLAWDKPGFELVEAARVGRFEDEGWRLRKDGTRFWSNVVITALRNSHDQLIGFAKVTRDLTERREAQQRALDDARRLASEETARRLAEERSGELSGLLYQMQLQAAELERRGREAAMANRAKADFLAAMSHELRTPLNAIGGYAELLLLGVRGPLTEDQQRDLERIRRSQQYLLGIINDILNFSRIEAGRLTYDLGRVAASEVVETVKTLLAPQATAKQIVVTLRQSDPDAVAWADRSKVEQILINLVGNAVKFTGDGGTITIDAVCRGDRVLFVVTDTGVGIPPDRLDAIFEPFVQVGRSLVHSVEGTGLGLAISRDLARAMGGDLTVRSTVDEGSVFTLALPLAPRDA